MPNNINPSNIHIFAFKGNISEDVLKLLSVKNKYFIDSNAETIRKFAKYITSSISATDLVLGLGKTNGTKELHIESECTNIFRNSTRRSLEKIKIADFITNAKKHKSMGSSYCNLISYLISSNMSSNNYAFIHIPSNYNLNKAAEEIANLLS